MIDLIMLDGKGLIEFGLTPQPGHEHSMLPDSVSRTKAIAGRHGLYDFGSTLTSRRFVFPLIFAQETSRHELQQRIRAFSAFLLDAYARPREMKMIFNYEPNVYYMVKYDGSLTPDRLFERGSFKLPLVAHDPFARFIINPGDITLDSDIILDSDIRLDDEYGFTVAGPGNVEVNNFGTLATQPEIVVQGSFTTLSITANGKTFGFGSAIAGQTLVIDGEQMKVKLGGANALWSMSGHFVDLLPGVNQVTIGGTGLNCTVSFNFKPKYA